MRLSWRRWRNADGSRHRTAGNGALLRRVYLNLIGLPPTLDEQDRFAKETGADALDQTVDDLLARPTYGEAGPVTGSTSFDMPTATATNVMRKSRLSGVIAIM